MIKTEQLLAKTLFSLVCDYVSEEPAAVILQIELSVVYERVVITYETTRSHCSRDHNIHFQMFLFKCSLFDLFPPKYTFRKEAWFPLSSLVSTV